MIKNYNEDTQKLLINVLLSDEDIYTRCQNILNPNYFVNKFRPALRMILSYTEKNKILPKIQQVNAETGLDFEFIDSITPQHSEAFLHEIEEFCKNRAIANAILSSTGLIEQGNYAQVEKLIKDAVTISLESNIGTNYFENPRIRLQRIRESNGTVSSGWKSLDEKLYGGWSIGSLNIFAAASGVGKSLFLQNLAINSAQQGLDVVYITLELSEELTSMRIDSMITEIGTRDIFKNLDTVELKVVQKGRKSGNLHIKQLPQGTRTNDLRAYLKNYSIQNGKMPEVFIVDYLDLMYPNDKRIVATEMFTKDKMVAEELRGLAVEFKMVCLVASQIGRQGINEPDHDQSMIAGGISKVNTADNVMSIYASTAMKERGEYQLQFLKTRSSNGVGSKITLGFDPNCLKIFHLDDEYAGATTTNNAAEMFADLRRKNSNKKSDETVETKQIEPKINDLGQLRNLVRRWFNFKFSIISINLSCGAVSNDFIAVAISPNSFGDKTTLGS